MNRFLRSLAPVAVLLMASGANAQLRVVSYNTLDAPANSFEEADARIIFEAIAAKSINGVAKRPDIVALQEQRTLTFSGGVFDSTGLRIANELNDLFGVTSYEVERVGIGTDLLMYVYDSATVSLESTSQIFSSGPRAAFRADFQPIGYTSSDAALTIYNSHMKAGDSSSDRNDRTDEATRIRLNADALGGDANVIYLGDMNLGSSVETAYGVLRSSGAAQAFDPLLLSSWPSVSTAEYLTQSTRTSGIGGGAGGGMDDRFDLQLVTDELLDGEGLSYIGPTAFGLESLDHSYQAFGNDGVSYNQSINNTLVGRSQPASVLNALFDFSDHLPVVVDYQLPAVLEVLAETVPATLPLGEVFEFDVTVLNAAAAVAEAGADELDYVVAGTGDASGGGGGSEAALAGGATFTFTLDTSSLGMKSGSIFATTTSEAAENTVQVIPIAYEVVGAAFTPGDFSGDGRVDNDDLNLLLVNWGVSTPPAPGQWIGDQPIGSAIDNDELNRLLVNWGAGFGGAVPEPTGALLAGVATALLGKVRRRG